MEYISGSTPIKSIFKGSNLVYQAEAPNEVLSYEFTGSSSFVLNQNAYTATISPYSTTLTDLGITELTQCNGAFENSNITNLISFPDTSKVTAMDRMFYNCTGLTSLDLSGWKTSNVTNMYQMFALCNNISTLNLNGWKPSSANNMSHMFDQCRNLTSLDLSGWNLSNVIDMSYMFFYCDKLTELNVTGWKINENVSYTNMFYSCTSLNKLILGNVSQDLYNWWVARLTNAGIQNNVTIEYTIV